MVNFKFIADSDIHFGKIVDGELARPRSDKANNMINILKEINDDPLIKCVIACGDLTEHGYDGKSALGWNYGGKINEFGSFILQYVTPIKVIKPIYMCAGNHDKYVPWPYVHKAVFDYIKTTYGDLKYSFDIEGVHFVCCHIYPDESILKFLQKDLEANKDKNIILFFHYNLIGPFSDWWTDVEKNVFYNVIKDYKISAILCGHFHASYVYKWNNIKVIGLGGSGFTLCNYEDGEVTTRIIK